ncbi:endonuclease/exonuclease/phosphatase family protein [Candidatus Uabimicrobium sp. HlEnr_7]|uniref:endonuclease/exonuclease/phosphatase family protein n=1 Tax=Candidatus Uabimicrobium helgolandensis TaxID=3095367 RepID=UPI0035590A0C
MFKKWCVIFFSLIITLLSEDLKVISWNVESSGSKNEVIAEQIEDLGKYHIWGFSEVPSIEAAQMFAQAAEKAAFRSLHLTTSVFNSRSKYSSIVGTTGRSDKLVIAYDCDRLQRLEDFELHHINIGGRVRSPVVAKFLDKKTNTQFYFMVNHLYRGNETARHEQSVLLNEWIAKQREPVIAAGDYNYDWQVKNGDFDHDRGYDLLTASRVVSWVRPEKMIRTQDSHYNSVLDFIFCSYDLWESESEIIVRDNDFPDDKTTSDHRPVAAVFSIP